MRYGDNHSENFCHCADILGWRTTTQYNNKQGDVTAWVCEEYNLYAYIIPPASSPIKNLAHLVTSKKDPLVVNSTSKFSLSKIGIQLLLYLIVVVED
jgi:hypothetical protein